MHSEEEKLNLETIKRYVDYVNGISSGSGDGLMTFISEDILWKEMPSIFRGRGRSGGLDVMLEALEKDKEQVSGQQFTIRDSIASGDKVVLEVDWEATVETETGMFPKGTKLTAKAVLIFKIKNGKIVEETDYFSFDRPEV